MTREEALKVLELLPRLLLSDICALIEFAEAGEHKEARRLAKKMRRARLFGG